MNDADIRAILPFLVLSAALTVIVLGIAVRRDRGQAAILAAIGLAATLASLWPAQAVAPRQVTPLFAIDGYALLLMGLILAESLAVVLLSQAYLARQEGPADEFYALLLLSTLGALALVSASHFASFFLGLETLTIPLLGLIAYPRERPLPIEAGVKYLILAAMSSAVLLFGMALVYARLGTMEFARMGAALAAFGQGPQILWLSGVALIFSGVAFKLSLVPFHLWVADVYEGSPAPVTAFIAVVSKTAVLGLLLRYFLAAGIFRDPTVELTVGVIAIASMLGGNLLALLQTNVKRLLAYSSVGHLGYLLVAFLAGGTAAIEAVGYYLVAYGTTTLGAFGVVTVLSTGAGREVVALNDYRSLAWRRPWLAAVFILMLLSLAGMPLTMGFFAKIYAAAAGVGRDAWPLVGALVAGSVIGLFYYLRVVVAVCLPAAGEQTPEPAGAAGLAMATLAGLTGILVWLGVYPAPAVDLIRGTARVFGMQ